jgi:hypothetical protein
MVGSNDGVCVSRSIVRIVRSKVSIYVLCICMDNDPVLVPSFSISMHSRYLGSQEETQLRRDWVMAVPVMVIKQDVNVAGRSNIPM